jgi:hypothetical protein
MELDPVINDHIVDDCIIDEKDLYLFAKVGTGEDFISLTVLRLLSLLSKKFYNVVQYRINQKKIIYVKYLKRFANAIHKRLIAHPITYTDIITKIIPIESMGFTNLGLCVLDTEDNLFNPNLRYAFSNVSFLVRKPIGFSLFLMLGNFTVYSKTILPESYIDLGENNNHEYLRKKYNDNPYSYPGRYFIDLDLPTIKNPILLNENFLDHRTLRLTIAQHYIVQHINGGLVADINFDPEFIINYFTHAVVRLKTVSTEAYNWSNYSLCFNGEINSHIHKFSMIRKKEDVVFEPNFLKTNGLPLTPLQTQLLEQGGPIISNITNIENRFIDVDLSDSEENISENISENVSENVSDSSE